ncbi:MAG: FHA domain-containing protein [Butyrivibrio sp.]|nr:FHA domain-containing protein [Butyrivibrio sp.]
MLKTNHIKGILPCTVRRINNEIYLYYCIDSKLSLSSCYEIKKMQADELRSLLKEMQKTIASVREYLLDESKIVYNVKAIYKEPSSERTFFALYPFENSDICFMDFAEQILAITDHEDENAISVAYRMCELAQNKELSVREIIEMLLRDEAQQTEPEPNHISQEKIQATTEWAEETGNFPNEEKSEKEKEKKDNNIIFACISFAIFAALCCLRKFFNLTYRENIISLTVMTITLLLTFISVYFEIRKRKKEKAEEKNTIDMDIDEFNTSDYNISVKSGLQYETESQNNFSAKKTEEILGETIFLNPEVLRKISRLYSRNTDTSMQIGLEDLPITVGKMTGRADCILKHSSISRIHARIFQNEQKQICLRDLNSTNGTFKNGIRLHPEEEIIINPGDEIGFGTLIFDYR